MTPLDQRGHRRKAGRAYSFRLPEELMDEVRRRSDAAGMTVSDYVREALLDKLQPDG